MKSMDSSKLKTKSQYYPDSRWIRGVIYVLCSKNQFNNGVDFKQRIGFSINLEEWKERPVMAMTNNQMMSNSINRIAMTL
ncbi:hypothetical protein HanXRQr2_Chr11g0468781 [Helianthus annuus]|uniref:Uncharacterized protein n=1 Tax=Helianthus annuus TaxID=4232 RepID=A0A251T755_HELAN|nr:hypothetical protein HanXRQr2_Chr11g0468781 [Helianthus annuus]KAJ0873421.1 hypothetical protein HanPSC8_Chr11g0452391 [Helianthus annuus]